MPNPISHASPSPARFYESDNQCRVDNSPPNAMSGAPPGGPTSRAGAAAASSDPQRHAPQANDSSLATEATTSLLEKYGMDLSAFRRSSAAPSQPAPPKTVPHDADACNEARINATLDCLDALGNSLETVDAVVSSPGSLSDAGTGVHMVTSALRCARSTADAVDACTDALIR